MYPHQQKVIRKKIFFVSILKATEEKIGIRIRKPVYESEDPDPYQNVMDAKQCLFLNSLEMLL
jgi:hypothetical protein